jgi:hypothetical protein
MFALLLVALSLGLSNFAASVASESAASIGVHGCESG